MSYKLTIGSEKTTPELLTVDEIPLYTPFVSEHNTYVWVKVSRGVVAIHKNGSHIEIWETEDFTTERKFFLLKKPITLDFE